MEQGEAPVVKVKETPRFPESLKNKRFAYTVVFGQGPVQEQEEIPRTGREGLNFYSRMLALSAGQMLKDGITDKVILTGGKTGAKARTQEGKTEADLMADIIQRHMTTVSEDSNAYIANGKRIERKHADGTPKLREEIDGEIKKAFSDTILIENEAQDTLQNFTFIINKYLPSADKDAALALLGIGFHANDTYSGAGVGRLAVLADIFDLGAEVYSAEDIVKDLITQSRSADNFVGKTLTDLAHTATHHEVSQLKSIQERILVEGLQEGEWVRVLPFLKDPIRVVRMILKDDYVRKELSAQLGISESRIHAMTIDELLAGVQQIKVTGTPEEYGSVKSKIFEQLAGMTDEKGTDYLAAYGKGTIPPLESTPEQEGAK